MQTEKVVFVRGTGRCGSKNLVAHLGQHPELAHVPVNQIVPEELIDWSRQRLQASDRRITDEAVAAACRAYFSAYGRALAGKDGILLQKSTRNAHHLSTLLEYWPEARIVYLVRHPLGVVEALINAAAHDSEHDYGPDYGYQAGVVDSLMQWHTELSEYLRSSAFGHPRLLQVHFEELVGDPRGTVAGICRFIGIRDVALPPYGGPEVYDAPFVLNEAERRWVIESTCDIVEKLGYAASDWTAAVPPESEPFLELHPQCRLGSLPPALDVIELTKMALTEAARLGYRRVGLFGAGYFARRVCPYLDDAPVEVVCVFDENPALAHSKIGAFPVHRADAAPEAGVEAVIPTTFVYQGKLVRRWRQLYGDGIPILPLWNEPGAELRLSWAQTSSDR